MTKTCAVLLMLAATAATLPAAAPVWDNSGNGLLSGDYYFRQVLYVADANGNPSRAIALYGTITFNNGNYTLSNLGGVDSANGTPNLNTITTYSLSSTGYGVLSDPLLLASSVSFLVSHGILIGSDTEAGYNEIFVAAPISSLSNASFTGAYTVSAIDSSYGIGATYQLNPDGAGHLGSFTINGYVAGGSAISQSASNIPYKFSNNAAVITYPNNNNANFYSGQEFVYFSPDTNFVFGGSPNGFDMFLGVKNAASGANTPVGGLYYEAGMEEYAGLDSFYGTLNALPSGDIVGHERLLFSAGSPYSETYWASYPANITGSYTDPSGTLQYTLGQNGFRLTYGTQGYVSTGIAIPFTPPTASNPVYIDPTGVVNTASSAPYTAGISPGEFLTFYNGVNLAPSTTVSDTVPYPTSLNGVKVLFNDVIAAPIYYVSANQVSVIVPYDVSTFPIAKIQISNNGVLSNAVTVNVNTTTPGVFTSDPVGGIGVAALLDFPAGGGYYVVTNENPAHPGDTVAAYLTGLGSPYPSNPSGAAGPIDGDSLLANIGVSVGGTDVGTLAYAGLAPGLAGLYQINFTIPSGAVAGQNILSVGAPDSDTSESYIPIAVTGSVAPAAFQPAARRKSRSRVRR